MTKLIINEDLISYVGVRVDKALGEIFAEQQSRSRIVSLINEEKVLINQKPCKTSTKLKFNDIIEYDFSENLVDFQLNFSSFDLPEIDVIYEDDALAVINKPRNLVVHPGNGTKGHTLVDILKNKFEELSDCNGEFRPGIVHRIDKDTSGLLVIAKTNEAHRLLAEQLKDHTMNREYLAIVRGNIGEQDGKIIAPIGRDKKDRTRMAVDVKEGKEAITFFHVEKRYKKHTFVSVRLLTGRTHQIRVHMAYIGHPVEGDDIYCRNCMDFNGQLLHAYKISFIHPISKENMSFEAKMPPYFEEALMKVELN